MAEITLALIGATGCIGREIVDLLQEDDRVSTLVPIASKGSKETHVSFRGDSVPIRFFEPSSFAGADLVISACSPTVGREPYASLVEDGIPLIDLSGVYGTDLPILAAGLQGGQGNRLREAGAVTAARPEAIVVARLVRVLKRVAPVLRVSGTLMMPAAIAGREGVEELSRQVVSMFNSQEAPRSRFPEGLAFDVIPSWGGVTERGWAGCELLNSIQVAMLSGLNPQVIALDVAVLPLFGGMAASLQFDLNPGWELERVLEELKETEDFEFASVSHLMPRKQIGSTEIAVGRVRANLSGTGLHLWICCDAQRLAAKNALDLMEELLWSEA